MAGQTRPIRRQLHYHLSPALWFLTSSICCLLCFLFIFWPNLDLGSLSSSRRTCLKNNFLLWISERSQSSPLLDFCSFSCCDLVGSSWCKAWWFCGIRLELFDPSWAKTVEFLVQLSSLKTNFQWQLHLGNNLHHHFQSCTFLLQVEWAVCQTLTAILDFSFYKGPLTVF